MKPQWKYLEDRVHELLGEGVEAYHLIHGRNISFRVGMLQIGRLAPLLPEVSIYVFPESDWEGKLRLTVIVFPKRRTD